jgi:GNAT superfamily N-acetyltransferase
MIIYRTAGTDDLPAVAQIYRKALADIYKRHGFQDKTFLPRGINPFYAFMLNEEPGGFFIAEDSGKIIGATFSWIRENLWFLSHLFILPEYQGKGVGRSLLEKTFGYSMRKGIYTRCVITMSFNTSSVSLYMRNGMLPLQNIFLFGLSGIPEALTSDGDAISWEYADSTSWGSDDFNSIDKEVLGFHRTVHHRYFIESQHTPCLLFKNRTGTLVAYAYLWPDGRIGPVAALKEAPFEKVLHIAVDNARRAGTYLTMMIPGANRKAIEAALNMGFTIKLPYILLSSDPFGLWGSYLFHSPGLM